MQLGHLFSRRTIVSAGVLAAVLIAGGVFAYEPVTRNLIARDGLCTYCHIAQEYVPTLLTSAPEPHPRSADGGQARCVDCHLPSGFWRTTFAYTHFVSLTDLFGHFRDLDTERAGDWIPPRAATAHRVRDRLYAYDSVTCRGCHAEAEIDPKSRRGKLAHQKARAESQTCIQCHYNMAHRLVELRVGSFQDPMSWMPATAGTTPDMDIEVMVFPDELAEK